MSFSSKILAWYRKNKRELPWRSTNEPYKIWLSEIMLQQTRVAQGIPYYHKFIKAFPTINDLANASETEILKLWQGLGYYSRARNMHFTANIIVDEYQGKFPSSYQELVKLKGVGDYTASAIASICFNEAVPVIDGNVYRVLSRFFGVDLPINSTKGAKYFKKLAKEVMAADEIRDYNQGIMEFGAIQCSPRNPNCAACPLNEGCRALQKNKVADLPVKLRKAKVTTRHFNYVVAIAREEKEKGMTLLEQRTGKGIWQQMYQFPLLESDTEIRAPEKIVDFLTQYGFGKGPNISLYNDKPIVHKLSHQHLLTKFWIVETSEKIPNGIAIETLGQYPVPVLIADFIKTFKF